MRSLNKRLIFGAGGDFSDIIGLGAEKEHMVSAQALHLAWLRYVPVAAMMRKAETCPVLGMELFAALSAELARLQDHLLIVGQRSAIERVANFLINLVRRSGCEREEILTLPMTRQDIGDFLGLTLETVSRTLTRLRLKGLIDFRQGSQITLLDRSKLEILADIRRD